MTTSVTLTGLKTTIYTDEGMDEVLVQRGAVTGDCWLEGGHVVKVVAPDGITFAGPSGTLTRPYNFNVTDLCDLAQLARDIRADAAERAAVRFDTRVFELEFA